MVHWQESAICYNAAHNPAASVKSSHLASGHTHSNTSTHSPQTGSWSKHSCRRGKGAQIWLLQAFYSSVPTRQCPPSNDEVSERAASNTMACQAQRARLTPMTRLFGAWQPVVGCLGTEQGVEDLNWTMRMWWWGVGSRGWGGFTDWLAGWPAGWPAVGLSQPPFGFHQSDLSKRNGFHARASQHLATCSAL